MAFLVVLIVFFVYDLFVQRRNEKIIVSAAKSNKVITSLFPGSFRDKVIESRDSLMKRKRYEMVDEKPEKEYLADLYFNTTLLFADIVGFTVSFAKPRPLVWLTFE